MKKLTLEQAKALLDDGIMTKKGFQKLVDDGDIKIFKFRSQTNKPEIVQVVHDQIVALIEENAYALFEAGYKPSIVWNSLAPKEETGEVEG